MSLFKRKEKATGEILAGGESAIANKEVEGLSQGQIVRRRFFRHRAAIRQHQEKRAGQAEAAQAITQATQIAFKDRLHIGVADSGGGAFVFADFRHDFG